MKIVILSAAPKSSATKSIIEAGEKRKHEMTVLNPAYLYLIVSDAVNGYDRIYDGYNKHEQPVRIKAKEIDAVISRIGSNLAYGSAVLQHFKENLNIFSTQSPEAIKIASDKLLSLQKISADRIKVPKTVIADKGIHLDWMLKQIGGLPAIAKILRGSQGIGVMILESKLQTNTTLETFYKQKTKLLLQQYIDANAKDIRAIVVDGEVVTAMERTAPKNDIRANISLGGSGKKIKLSDADKDICVRSARACGLEVAGVDIMKDTNGTTYTIEVNGNYGYKIERITGDDISTPLIKYCERNAGTKEEKKNGETEGKKQSFANRIISSISNKSKEVKEEKPLTEQERAMKQLKEKMNAAPNDIKYKYNVFVNEIENYKKQ